MPTLNQGAIERIGRVVKAVERRLDDVTDPDTPIINHGGEGGDSIIGKLDGAITATGSATLSIWTGTPGSESDSGDNVTVYNWAIGALDSGTKVVATKINGYYYLTGILPKTTQITVQTTTYWNGTAHKLQLKNRTAKVIDPGTESSYSDIDTAACATACS